MGGAVSIHSPCTPAHNEFKELYENKKAMSSLFSEIANFDHVDRSDARHSTDIGVQRLDIKNKICLSEIIFFINREQNPIFAKNLTKNVMVIKEAFKFAIGPKASKNYTNHEMGKKQFRKLVPALLLFSELYNIFHVADSSIDDDKIFPNEYRQCRNSICNISGVTVNPVSEEDWDSEFKMLDKNGNGYISFSEFCKYCLAKIITPSFYLNEVAQRVDDEMEVIDTVGHQVVEATFTKSLSEVSIKRVRTELSLSGVGDTEKEVTPIDRLEEEQEDTADKENQKGTTPVDKVEEEQEKTPADKENQDKNVVENTAKTEENGEVRKRLTREASRDCISTAISQSLDSLQQKE